MKIDEVKINELKAKHGTNNLFLSEVEDNDGACFSFVCVKPTRTVLKAIVSNKNNEEKILETLISNCVLDGDMEALNNADVYAKVAEDIATKIGGAKSTIKKL